MSAFKLIILKNDIGEEVHITNFGARIVKWLVTIDKSRRNIILGYDQLEDYQGDPAFLGAIVGPYANRIKNASVDIEGTNYPLQANEGANQLHGGDNGLSDQLWQIREQTQNSVVLICKLVDGFNGYPGPLSFEVNYKLIGSCLTISQTINSPKMTIAGPTTHPYFNLNGTSQSAQGHQLKLVAQNYTPMNDSGIPTGDIKQVKGTAFDFTKMRLLPFGKNGLDDNFLLTPDTAINDDLLLHGELTSADTKLSLVVSSNYPAMQVYTGQHLPNPFNAFDGICLEPQFCPNSPNQQNFPYQRVSPNIPLTTKIHYTLKAK